MLIDSRNGKIEFGSHEEESLVALCHGIEQLTELSEKRMSLGIELYGRARQTRMSRLIFGSCRRP